MLLPPSSVPAVAVAGDTGFERLRWLLGGGDAGVTVACTTGLGAGTAGSLSAPAAGVLTSACAPCFVSRGVAIAELRG
jgi:hypothetical protein